MRRRVLLVEDDDDDRNLLSHVVQILARHDLTVARDGREAINLAREEHFDLVLLDLNLPNVKGWDVAESLRQMDTNHDVPIIAITAYDLANTREQSLEAGCNDYVTKPVDIDNLLTIISGHVGTNTSPVM